MPRHDLQIIAKLIEPGAKVIDIGCGEGDLLELLQRQRQVDGRGLEISQNKVSTAVGRGLAVIQGDADTDLKFYPHKSFDYAILGQTLQATKNPRDIMQELTRIAKYAIISFPNFGHISNRLYLMLKGRMPVTKNLSYEWYETPNIHFCTIRDFIILCNELGLVIEKKFLLSRSGNNNKILNNPILTNTPAANLFTNNAIFLLKSAD